MKESRQHFCFGPPIYLAPPRPELRQNLTGADSPMALLASIHSLNDQSLIDSQY